MTGKSTKKTRRKYDDSFKEDVLKMIMSGRPVTEVSEALGVSENLIYTWKKKAQKGAHSANGAAGGYNAEVLKENERLRAELKRAEQERDILKKALVVFSRGT
jgi:transposase